MTYRGPNATLEQGTFSEVFDYAAIVAEDIDIDQPPTLLGWCFGQRVKPWRPTKDERRKALQACRKVCRESLHETGKLPSESTLRKAARDAVGVGPLTILWIAVMVAKLLLILRQWKNL